MPRLGLTEAETAMAKALIEEAAIAEIPSLIIDPQGDLAIGLRVNEDELVAKGMKEECKICRQNGDQNMDAASVQGFAIMHRSIWFTPNI